MKPFKPALLVIDSTAKRKAHLERLKRNIIDLPDPIQDIMGLWRNNGGEWRTYHSWMLEMRAEILGLLREWPDHAPLLKLDLINAVYNKAVTGQIAMAFHEDIHQNDIYTRTHPLLKREEVDSNGVYNGVHIGRLYGSRQAMLISFIQLYEWLRQDNESLSPFSPNFIGFQGKLRLPEDWIAVVGQRKAELFGMAIIAAMRGDTTFALPPVQYFSDNVASAAVAPDEPPIKERAKLHFVPGFTPELFEDAAERAGIINSKANGYGLAPKSTAGKLCGCIDALLKNNLMKGDLKQTLIEMAKMYDVKLGKKVEYPDKNPNGRTNFAKRNGRMHIERELIALNVLERRTAFYHAKTNNT